MFAPGVCDAMSTSRGAEISPFLKEEGRRKQRTAVPFIKVFIERLKVKNIKRRGRSDDQLGSSDDDDR